LQLVESFGPIIPQKDRREGRQEKVFPVRRRSSDGDLMMESHYYSFLEYLHRVSKTERPPLVVVGKGIGYLAERIKSIFPGSRVVIVGTLADRIPDGSLIVLNLDCRRRHEAFSFLDFREVAVKTGGRQEPLETLSRVSELTSAGTRLNLVSLGKIHNQDIARKFLRVSKFEEAVFTGDHTVRVKKRELYHQKFGNGSYVVEEVQGREDVDKIQAFSERFFSKDYNFSKIVDDLFTNHSDFYRITDLRTHAIVTCARVTWHLPNHYLPCMLAHKAETDEHLQLNKPDKLSYIEIYAPYFTSVASARNYGEFLKIFLNYGERGVADVAFTTYNAGSPHEGKIFHRTFGFKETGLTLKYGDFGGDWELVYCTVGTFRENVKVKLVSSVNMPSILKKYVKGR